MTSRTRSAIGRWLKDMALGAALFLLLPLLAGGPRDSVQPWSTSAARAADVIASRAIETTAPASPEAENAIIAAAQLRPSGVLTTSRRPVEFAILGLTFSLLVALNLAFWRHLRRVRPVSQAKGWGREA